ncbi:hypothetical protein ASE14_04200 [Agromyces sp. Root81]|uniref:hypothetical protein n=1 Tax=Agromyces sp. Root81 TaxID=1736601 RepID=UPI0006FC1AC9|nr:hypothetical protein [Agromyces sp. Root81]KRC62999.1 hypothetical protein ASE14_04200 [Agromyces sp. Root81]
MGTIDPDSPLVSGELQVLRWVKRTTEVLQFTWTPGREVDPLDEDLVGVEHFEDQPKLGPAVLYDHPMESSYTTSIEKFTRNRDSGVVRIGSQKSEASHDQTWFRRPPLDPARLEEILDRLRAEPPSYTFFDEYWTRAQFEGRQWYSVHGLARRDDGLHEVIVLCCCPDDPPSVSARAALAQVEAELGYDFAAVEVQRTYDTGPAVSGIGALRIERKLAAP